MRRRYDGKGKRSELGWLLAGFVAVQLGLGVAVDRFWVRVRDPEYAARLERLTDRRRDAANRPLILILGSSRTELGLRAGDLSRSTSGSGPLVFNFAIPGSGPMFQQVVLRRLLAAGVRPDHVVIEVMPISMSRRGGTPQEETQLDAARLNAFEMARVSSYYHPPFRLIGGYAAARLLPADRHQAELRDAIALDAVAPSADAALDDFGWRRRPAPRSRDEFDANVRFALRQYSKALNDGTPADGPLRAFTDLLALCRDQRIPTALVVPPEASMFRERAADYSAIDSAIRVAAPKYGARLYDARSWIEDVGFYDGHHLTIEGAEEYTERFRREVLEPELARTTQGTPIAAANTGH